MCYLPLNSFLLRPLHRLMHYKQVLERLCKHHEPSHADFRDCRGKQAGPRAPLVLGVPGRHRGRSHPDLAWEADAASFPVCTCPLRCPRDAWGSQLRPAGAAALTPPDPESGPLSLPSAMLGGGGEKPLQPQGCHSRGGAVPPWPVCPVLPGPFVHSS